MTRTYAKDIYKFFKIEASNVCHLKHQKPIRKRFKKGARDISRLGPKFKLGNRVSRYRVRRDLEKHYEKVAKDLHKLRQEALLK